MRATIQSLPARGLARFGGVSTPVVFLQVFLGVGWLRAAVAHAVSRSWWNGTELETFLDTKTALANPLFHPFLTQVVARIPEPVSFVVLVAEFAVGVLLLANRWPRIASAVGIFLNLNFILAGVVNPSVFYILMGGAILLDPLARGVEVKRAEALALRTVAASAVAAFVLMPFIKTFNPKLVIEDPSMVLIALLVSLCAAMGNMVRQSRLLDRESEPLLASVTISGGGRAEPGFDDGAGSAIGYPLRAGPGRQGPGSGGRRGSRGGRSSGNPRRGVTAVGDPADTTVIDITADEGVRLDRFADQTTVNRYRKTESGRRPAEDTWYSVRCHFALDDGQYQERITVWPASSFDSAISKAESEARGYARSVGGQYLNSCDAYTMGRTTLVMEPGAEFYSLIRFSSLPPNQYLESFFFTGDESSVAV